ncbi:uncharacterized protein LOC119990091 isoform X2 [Tripterygium wilfordii]|uniref:uncharacterized protein LOC119990091 isoform X2 n=1 Tax=Tripterygium wilfordii TaxID=458696 RepID=UPI0018F85E11|nr:uncharacterized protein LOC119990091 isoform X2 [Tripterygium wilfordii]
MEKYRIPTSPDLTSRHLPSTFGDGNIGAILEESQKRFSFPEQGTLDLGLLNAGVSQFTQVAGTSRGVNVTIPNHSDEPIISSRIPNACDTGGNFPKSETKLTESEKKRLCGKAYRERMKLERKKRESDLAVVGSENKVWKMENERLRSEIDVMYQSLQAIAGENQILKTQVRCLKREMNQQVVLVDAFSHKQLLQSHEDHQLLMLRQERERLLGNVTWNPQMEEKKQLLVRKVNLEHHNRALKFQVQALCEKIYNDKNHE